MKTIQDYMTDPRILNDPGCDDILIREIHAARLKLQDETAGMTVQERCDYLNNKARDVLSSIGADPLLVSFPDGGKLRPRTVQSRTKEAVL
ncbi:hypothetical protein [Leadbettera azotonutricia]|uniref:Uncharacterized protein n=1 Tax=Leadbettera azotonutricia (strain ATCC BAA-888 / DSM 13862 / ZAS-9) TaxID=545695 RepID=F5YBH1_LEAAZ|nr:hypothetical protein [Leadbettera azotonutricia]AEF80246.1 hypothetical protein TREAZ_0614 [Leadbettera azotonutricia ZAS-9]